MAWKTSKCAISAARPTVRVPPDVGCCPQAMGCPTSNATSMMSMNPRLYLCPCMGVPPVWHLLRLSRFKLIGPPTPRETEASNAYAVIHDALGPVCICSLIGINSIKATLFEPFEQGNPVDAGRLHHHSLNLTLSQPLRQDVEIGRKRPKA